MTAYMVHNPNQTLSFVSDNYLPAFRRRHDGFSRGEEEGGKKIRKKKTRKRKVAITIIIIHVCEKEAGREVEREKTRGR